MSFSPFLINTKIIDTLMNIISIFKNIKVYLLQTVEHFGRCNIWQCCGQVSLSTDLVYKDYFLFLLN